MENLIVAVNCVIPVFICLAVGYIAKMRRVIPEGTYQSLQAMSSFMLFPICASYCTLSEIFVDHFVDLSNFLQFFCCDF